MPFPATLGYTSEARPGMGASCWPRAVWRPVSFLSPSTEITIALSQLPKPQNSWAEEPPCSKPCRRVSDQHHLCRLQGPSLGSKAPREEGGGHLSPTKACSLIASPPLSLGSGPAHLHPRNPRPVRSEQSLHQRGFRDLNRWCFLAAVGVCRGTL